MVDEMALVRIENVLGRLELSVERLRWEVAKLAVAPAQQATNSAMDAIALLREVVDVAFDALSDDLRRRIADCCDKGTAP